MSLSSLGGDFDNVSMSFTEEMEPDKKLLVSPLSGVFTTLSQVMRHSERVLSMSDMECLEYSREHQQRSGKEYSYNEDCVNELVLQKWDAALVSSTINQVLNVVPMNDIVTQCHNVGVSLKEVGLSLRDPILSQCNDLFLFDNICNIENTTTPFLPPEYSSPSLNKSPIVDLTQYDELGDIQDYVVSMSGTLLGDKYFLSLQKQQHALVELAPFEFQTEQKVDSNANQIRRKCVDTPFKQHLEPSHDDQVYRLQLSNYQRSGGLHAHTKQAVQNGVLDRGIPALALTLMLPKGKKKGSTQPTPPSHQQPEEQQQLNIMQFASRKQQTYNLEKKQLNLQRSLYSRAERVKVRQCVHAQLRLHVSEHHIDHIKELLNSISNALPNDLRNIRQWFSNVKNKDNALRQLGLLIGDVFYEKNEQGKYQQRIDHSLGLPLQEGTKYSKWLQLFGAPMGEEESVVHVQLKGQMWPHGHPIEPELANRGMKAPRGTPSVLQNGVEDQVASVWSVFLEVFDACTSTEKQPNITNSERQELGLFEVEFLSNVEANKILRRPQLGDVAERYHDLFSKLTARFSEFGGAFTAFDESVKSYLELVTKQIQNINTMEAQYKHQENTLKLQMNSTISKMHGYIMDLRKYQQESSVLKNQVLININRTKVKMADYKAVTNKLSKMNTYLKQVQADTHSITEMNTTQLKPKLYTYMNNILQLQRTEMFLKKSIAMRQNQLQKWRLLATSWLYKQQVHVLGRSYVYNSILLGKLREKALFSAILNCLSSSNEDVIDTSEKLDTQVLVFEEQVQNVKEEQEDMKEEVIRAEKQFHYHEELYKLTQNEVQQYKEDLITRSSQVDDILGKIKAEEQTVVELQEVRSVLLDNMSKVTEELVQGKETEESLVVTVREAELEREALEQELIDAEKEYEATYENSLRLFEEKAVLETEKEQVESSVRAKSEEYMEFMREIMAEVDVVEKEKDIAKGRHFALKIRVQMASQELEEQQMQLKKEENVLLEKQTVTAQKTVQRQKVQHDTEELIRSTIRYENNQVPLTVEERKVRQAEEIEMIQALQGQVKGQTENVALWSRGKDELQLNLVSEQTFVSAIESEITTKLEMNEQERVTLEQKLKVWSDKKTVVMQQNAACSQLQDQTKSVDKVQLLKRNAIQTMQLYLDRWKSEKPVLETKLSALGKELENTLKQTHSDVQELDSVDGALKQKLFQMEGLQELLQGTDVQLVRHLLSMLSHNSDTIGCVGSIRNTVYIPIGLLSITRETVDFLVSTDQDNPLGSSLSESGLLTCIRNLQCSKECKVVQNYPLGVLDTVRTQRSVLSSEIYPLIPTPNNGPLQAQDSWIEYSNLVLEHALFTETVRALVLECVHIYVWNQMKFVDFKRVQGKNIISVMEAATVQEECMTTFVPQLQQEKIIDDAYWQYLVDEHSLPNLLVRIENTVEQLHVQLHTHIQSINTHSYLLKQHALTKQNSWEEQPDTTVIWYPNSVLKQLSASIRPQLHMQGEIAYIQLDCKKLIVPSPIPSCSISQHNDSSNSIKAYIDGSYTNEIVTVPVSTHQETNIRVTYIPKYICACHPCNTISPCTIRLPLELLVTHIVQAFPDDFLIFSSKFREISIKYHDLFEFYWHTMHPLCQAQLLASYVRDVATTHQQRVAEIKDPQYPKKFYVPPVYDQEDSKPIVYTQTREIGVNTTTQQVDFSLQTPVYLQFNFNSEEADAASRHDELTSKNR